MYLIADSDNQLFIYKIYLHSSLELESKQQKSKIIKVKNIRADFKFYIFNFSCYTIITFIVCTPCV